MCGILYVKLKNNDDSSFSLIFKKALELMAYRGKDAFGYHQVSNNYFGHVRLAILDLSSRSNQPVISEKHIILFKGEIYNYKHLVTGAYSDTMAIAMMIDSGRDISHVLCGMYAIIIYDKRNQAVKVVRDFYGEKPVYYYHDKNIFIVSSTIKSIIYILKHKYGLRLNIHPTSLDEYLLCGYIREPRTIYKNIHMLSSGHEMHVDVECHVSINNLVPAIITKSPFTTEQHALNSLKTTDVEPGLLLSSGVDSTYLLSLLQNELETFSILTYKAPIKKLDESSAALNNINKICIQNKPSIHILENHNDIYQLYNEYANLLEQPSSDGINLYNLLSVSRKKLNDLKLIILGTGGDELYGGYHSFSNYRKISVIRKLRFLKSYLPARYKRFFRIASNPANSVDSYYFLYRICPYMLPYISQKSLDQIFFEFKNEIGKYVTPHLNNPYQKIKICESFDYMRNQLLRDSDNISLYCGYEARNPFLAVKSYLIKPDSKQMMKLTLARKHRITFKNKKGFTFHENRNDVCMLLLGQISELNNTYKIIPQAIILQLMDSTTPNLPLIRKLYLLLTWFKVNEITQQQLHVGI